MNSIDEIEALLIKNIESKAFKCVQNLAADIPAGEEQEHGDYVLGYLDGLSDLCDTLKGTIHKWTEGAKGNVR